MNDRKIQKILKSIEQFKIAQKSSQYRDLIKFSILLLCVDLTDEEIQLLEPTNKMIEEAKRKLIMNRDESLNLTHRLVVEIRQQREDGLIDAFWNKYSNGAPLKWKEDLFQPKNSRLSGIKRRYGEEMGASGADTVF